jgi:hypothetical protein
VYFSDCSFFANRHPQINQRYVGELNLDSSYKFFSPFLKHFLVYFKNEQPSVVVQTVRTPGSISTNKEFCSFSDEE